MAPLPVSRIFVLILSCSPISLIAAAPPVEWAKIVGQSVSGRPVICYDVATDSKNNIFIATGANWGLAEYSPGGDFLSRSGIGLNDFTRIYEVRCVTIIGDAIYSGGNNEFGAFGPVAWRGMDFPDTGRLPLALMAVRCLEFRLGVVAFRMAEAIILRLATSMPWFSAQVRAVTGRGALPEQTMNISTR